MDHFGIGNALRGVANAYFQGARRTGRTTSLIDSLKDGDRVCFASHPAAGDFKRKIRDLNGTITLAVVNPKEPDRLFNHGPSKGRTIFDHTWVEQYYMAAIERATREIDDLQKYASLPSEDHIDPCFNPSRRVERRLECWPKIR